MPPDPQQNPTGMVFNMAYGIQGNCRYTHVPAMLEMAGVPYTGSSPLGHALALDKVITKRLLREAGIPTPNYRVLRSPEDSTAGLHFPVVVKPRHESTSFGLQLIADPAAVAAAVEAIVVKYQQEALVEEYVAGREVCVALLGNDAGTEIFPLVEHDFGDRSVQLVTCDDKMHKVNTEPGKLCPASLPEALAAQLRDIALATFRVCHCLDYARVDIRLNAEMNPFVLEINSMASLGPTGSYMLAAKTAGYSFDALIGRILDVAHRRYFAKPMPAEQYEAEQMPAPGQSRQTLFS
jgi:D-alanine-D-alanine ligase